MPRHPFIAVSLAFLALAPGLAAQCADGGAPPCRSSQIAAAHPVPIEANRIAILPFRITTADSLLGEGLAELIATEFTGESGVRAVHMGTVLRAWRRAGGGLRSPLSQPDEMRVAREAGAGMLIEGSVVGLGSRLRITATIVSSQGGATRAVEPVSGAADSLEPLVQRLSASLLASAGGRAGGKATHLTDSPTAMRAYLEGLALWRRSATGGASQALERAFAADTLFAAAAFMRYRMGSWELQTTENRPWAERSQLLRDRLSAEDRLVLVDYFGEVGASRTRGQALTDRRRVSALLPESPDAQYLLGDEMWHYGAAYGGPTWLAVARQQFERGLALDSMGPIAQHLLEVGLVASDTALIRRASGAVERFYGGLGQWPWLWIAAGRLNDVTMLTALRRQAREQHAPIMAVRAGLYGLSAALIDEMYALTQQYGTPERLDLANRNYFVSATLEGRPGAATRAIQNWSNVALRDVLVVDAALFADGDMAEAAAAARRLVTAPPADSTVFAAAHCAVAHWRIRVDSAYAATDAEAELRRFGQTRCADAVALVRVARSGGAALDAALPAADSGITARAMIVNYGEAEHILLARLWESRGNLPRALDAIRFRSTFQGLEWTAATCARMEGRLAAATGDTTGALRAYRHYLLMRQEPEPALIPQRDSVRAELARLERRR